jgi:Lrp/AsnC family leucine-responsive transcriptional regulator
MGTTITRNIPEILECYRVTGTDDYIMKIAAPSVAALEDLIDRVSSYGSCITSLVLSTPLSGRIIRKDLGTRAQGSGIGDQGSEIREVS